MSNCDTEFAVVDVETTGFSPKARDRILEIAIVRTSFAGEMLATYHTLVNPGRDVGPTHIHGLTARDVVEAPSFEEVSGDILDLLGGAVFVAHNAPFDLRFVRYEFERQGCILPQFPYLCTMQLARRADGNIPCRRLSDLCAHFGVSSGRNHSALDDALAASSLLRTCLQRIGCDTPRDLKALGVRGGYASVADWPRLPCSGRSFTRRDARCTTKDKHACISALIQRLPADSTDSVELDEYLALLDRVLEDRRVTAAEMEELAELAEEIGLGQDAVREAHRAYTEQLVDVVLRDGIVTEGEERDLKAVGSLLGVSLEEIGDMLVDRAKRPNDDPSPTSGQLKRDDMAGKAVCFTGESSCNVAGERITRQLAEQLAREHGLVVKSGVSKKLDFLVTADAESMSGKAKKARELNVRVLSYRVFWERLGVDIE